MFNILNKDVDVWVVWIIKFADDMKLGMTIIMEDETQKNVIRKKS